MEEDSARPSLVVLTLIRVCTPGSIGWFLISRSEGPATGKRYIDEADERRLPSHKTLIFAVLRSHAVLRSFRDLLDRFGARE